MVSTSWTAGVEFFLFYPERTGGFGLELSSLKLENVQPVCHMRHRRVLAVVFFSSRGSLSCTSEQPEQLMREAGRLAARWLESWTRRLK